MCAACICVTHAGIKFACKLIIRFGSYVNHVILQSTCIVPANNSFNFETFNLSIGVNLTHEHLGPHHVQAIAQSPEPPDPQLRHTHVQISAHPSFMQAHLQAYVQMPEVNDH